VLRNCFHHAARPIDARQMLIVIILFRELGARCKVWPGGPQQQAMTSRLLRQAGWQAGEGAGAR